MFTMKKWIVFLLGLISGVVLTLFAAYLVALGIEAGSAGMTFFEEPGNEISSNQFEVMQALGNNYALAYEQEYRSYGCTSTDLLVLLTNDNGEPYYDKQVVKVPAGMCMRQVGIYKYETKLGDLKTVPIVKLMNK